MRRMRGVIYIYWENREMVCFFYCDEDLLALEESEWSQKEK